ncbi:DUF3653 domain-containing protein [Luteimonas panaciterrae]
MDDSEANPSAWYGWRLQGRHLVSPDGQRIRPEFGHASKS